MISSTRHVLASLLLAVLAQNGSAAPQLEWKSFEGYRALSVALPQPGKVGFTLLDGARTAVQFTNYLSLPTAARNQNLVSGAGVAAGDFDNDGWCDLYFCSVEGRNSLYRNLGGWRFEDVTSQAGVEAPGMLSTGALFADVNGDGFLDLLVTANNGPNALFLNQGNGRFTNATAAAGLTSRPLGSTSMAAADLNGDGALDLFVANYGENTVLRSGGEVSFRMVNGRPVVSGRNARRLKIVDGRLIEFGEPSTVYLNDGNGRFRPLSWLDGTFRDEDGNPLKELPMDLSLSVMMRDINGDGAPDIYVCNDFQVPDRIWINDGKARFRMLPRLAMRNSSVFSMGVDFADLDRDGYDDFFVCDMLSRFHHLRMTQMTDTNLMPSAVGAIDDRPQIRRNTLFHNRGDGSYAEIANFAGVAASDWSWTPAFVDVDLDGYEDLLVSNGHAYDTQDLDVNERPGKTAPGAAGAVQHLLTFPRLETPNFAFQNQRNLTFQEVGGQWGFNSTQVCHGLIFADLDNDGDLDVAVSSLNAPALLYRNDSAAPRVAVRLAGKAPNTKGINARIRVLGGAVPVQSQEMIAGGRYLSSDEPIRTFAAGNETNRLTIEVTWRSGGRSTISNLAANCIYEIDERTAVPVVPAPPATPPVPLFKDVSRLINHVHAETVFDDFALQPLLNRRLSQAGPGVAWFDLDGDGRDELFIGTGRGGALATFKNDARGGFVRVIGAAAAADDLLGMAGIIAPTGGRSLLVARSGYETTTSSGVLTFSATAGRPQLLEAITRLRAATCIAVADVDGDGTLEAFVGGGAIPGRYPEFAPSAIYRQQDGRFVLDAANSAVLQQAGIVNGAVWSDLNGDGLPDLLLACEWGPIRVFMNNGGVLQERTLELGLAAMNGWWTSVASADFDGDGQLDIVAGNWGMNRGIDVSSTRPAHLFYGDVDGDGRVELIDGELDMTSGAIVPRENLTILAPAMPFLRARFPTHASMRAVNVSRLLGERASQVRQLSVTMPGTTVFLNRGSSFDVKPLPREAQWAPVFGLNAADLDGDGNVDLFLAQNFFAMRKDIPRLDAGRGLFLRGNGQGLFQAVNAPESGLAIWGEQRGSAVADFDGDGRIDLVVAQNGAETKLFHNQKANPGLRVRLHGPPGNRDGVGAVMRITVDGRPGAAHPVQGGSGYGSQDSVIKIVALPRGASRILQVRWPGGRVSEQAIPPSAREVIAEFAHAKP